MVKLQGFQLMGFGLNWDYKEAEREFSSEEINMISLLAENVNNKLFVMKLLATGYEISIHRMGQQKESLDVEKYIPVYKRLRDLEILEEVGDEVFELSGNGFDLWEKALKNL